MNKQEFLIPDEIARISFLANRCLSHVQQDLAEEALFSARKATEGMLYNVSRHNNFIKDTKPRSLKDYLDIFRGKPDLVPQVIYRHIETIQHFGNDAGHYQAIEILYDKRTLQNCLNALASIILWYIEQFPESSTKCLCEASQSLVRVIPADDYFDVNGLVETEQNHFEHSSMIKQLYAKANDKQISAMLYLAKLYKQGYAGVPRDLDEAIRIYKACIDTSNDDIAISMALDEISKIFYSRHQYEDSFRYALESAELGNPRIMVHLSFLYSEGIGVKQDKKAAEKWYMKAAESNCPIASVAYYDLARLYMYSAQDKAIRQTLLQAAAQHHIASCYKIGKAYTLGMYDFPKDFNEAKEWLELAADEGNSDAMYELGRLYYLGDSDFPSDFSVAQQWFERGMQLKHVGSTYHLGYLHEFGFFGDADYRKAKAYYKEAADQGHLYSQYNYGFLCLMDTQRMKPEYSHAKKYLEKAAQQNFAMAYCALAEMEYLGLGQTPKKSRARSLFYEARARGDVWPDIILDALS